jgi:endonuclease YncB( thermonuclease family)
MRALIRRLRPLLLLFLLALARPALGAQETPPTDAEYVASSRGEVYYWKGCGAWRRLAVQNRRYFRTAEEAQAAGYRPSQTRGCAGPPSSGAAGSAPITAPGTAPVTATTSCVVVRIYDGDTITCDGGRRVRLLLIDTPEMDQGEFGRLARNALLALVPLGTAVQLEYDVVQQDRYGRDLAYVYAPGVGMVNEALARQGFATIGIYPPNVRHVDAIRAAVAAARAEQRGLWIGSAFDCLPADHRAGRCRR